ncbi:MAG: hypothetical protein ABIL68_09260, partial [bacterium]
LYRSGKPCEMDKKWAIELGRKAAEFISVGLEESVFLTLQKSGENFLVHSIPMSSMKDIEHFHRFVPDAFYDPNSFSATDLALDYFKSFC